MKNIIAGFIGAIVLALPVSAQEYGALPADCANVINYVCYESSDDGQIIYTVPAALNENYILTVQPIGIHNFFVLVDRISEEPAAYILVNDQGRVVEHYRGELTYGGDITLMRTFVSEMLDMLSVLPW